MKIEDNIDSIAEKPQKHNPQLRGPRRRDHRRVLRGRGFLVAPTIGRRSLVLQNRSVFTGQCPAPRTTAQDGGDGTWVRPCLPLGGRCRGLDSLSPSVCTGAAPSEREPMRVPRKRREVGSRRAAVGVCPCREGRGVGTDRRRILVRDAPPLPWLAPHGSVGRAGAVRGEKRPSSGPRRQVRTPFSRHSPFSGSPQQRYLKKFLKNLRILQFFCCFLEKYIVKYI